MLRALSDRASETLDVIQDPSAQQQTTGGLQSLWEQRNTVGHRQEVSRVPRIAAQRSARALFAQIDANLKH